MIDVQNTFGKYNDYNGYGIYCYNLVKRFLFSLKMGKIYYNMIFQIKNTGLMCCLIIMLGSCEKNSKIECRYLESYWPSDTSLFISYNLEGSEYQYFQSTNNNAPYHLENMFLLLNGRFILTNEWGFFFSGIDHSNQNNLIPEVTLSFYDTTIYDGYIRQKALRNRLHTNYRFITPLIIPIDSSREMELSDTLFFEGVELNLNLNKYSTENLIKHFEFNKDSIIKYICNESTFSVSKIYHECGFNKSIEGSFETTVSDFPYTKTIKVKDGRFRIYINH